MFLLCIMIAFQIFLIVHNSLVYRTHLKFTNQLIYMYWGCICCIFCLFSWEYNCLFFLPSVGFQGFSHTLHPMGSLPTIPFQEPLGQSAWWLQTCCTALSSHPGTPLDCSPGLHTLFLSAIPFSLSRNLLKHAIK